MTNYTAAAAVLDELMMELKDKGAEISSFVVSELKTGRSFAGIAARQEGEIETEAKAMSALQNVEMHLLSLAEQIEDIGYAEKWQKRIIDAYFSDAVVTASQSSSRHLTGIPKGTYFVRIQEEYLKDVDNLAILLEEYGLTSQNQDDSYVLILGKKEDVTLFLQKVREIVGRIGDKCNN